MAGRNDVARAAARELRLGGLTVPVIAERLGVSRSSAWHWTRDLPKPPRSSWKPRVDKGPNKLARARLAQIAECDEWARTRLEGLDQTTLLVAGVALYAGEGAKADGSVIFANTNPDIMRYFCSWLRTFFEVDESRLRGRVYLHEGLDLDAATAFWSEVTGIPRAQFRAPYRAVADPTRRKSKHVNGCAYVTYACSRTHRMIMGLSRALLSCDLRSDPA
ncbi:MAG: helix-turn-helix domain-containing protein [Mycobacteriales bacterium]|nr:hypothetical protein [Frankia sp.]